MTSRFLLALERIFRLFDRDHDHVLSEQELLNFQSVCFQVVLTPSDLRGLREVLEEQDAGAVHQGTNGITMAGFVILNKMFIERNKAESNWRVLEMFGYDRDLRLRIDERELAGGRAGRGADPGRSCAAPPPRALADGWKLPPRRGRQVLELNSRGQQFLRNVFTQFSNSNSACPPRLRVDLPPERLNRRTLLCAASRARSRVCCAQCRWATRRCGASSASAGCTDRQSGARSARRRTRTHARGRGPPRQVQGRTLRADGCCTRSARCSQRRR